MSAIHGDLFYLPLQSALSVADLRTISAHTSDSDSSYLNPTTFWAQFVGDQSNQGLQCLADPTKFHPTFWPLVLYGGSGNGKTSIAMAFANRLANEQGLSPLFIRAADLVRRHRDAIQTDRLSEFRKRFMAADLLIVDDLHVLKNRTSVQQELAKLIDALQSRKKPFIATLDSMPSTCESLIPQLASRLSGGLVLPVNRPGQAARHDIAIQLSQRFELKLDNSAIDFIVDHCDFSVPRLTQLFAQLKHSWQTKATEETLSDRLDANHVKLALFGNRAHYDRDIQLISKIVAKHFELSVEEVRGKSRKQTTVLARSICIYLCRDLLQISFAKIGRCFGGRDHSTIIHGHKNMINQMKRDTALVNTIRELRRKLTDQFLLVVQP